eukprot:GEMP01056299.1.p1 GENE.GEMP01056299.1~~GEMP01056299.1.p1  ORF type:complete len:258 (+),score=46.40 GEMP01056299.1:296-1069(+)
MKAFFALAVVLADNQAPKVSALHRTASAELLLDGAEGEVANARENLAPEFSDLRLNDGILRSFLEATSKKEAPALGSEKLWPVEEGKTCPTPTKVSSFNSKSQSADGGAESSEGESDSVADEYGNCKCPTGTICITTDLLMKFDEIKSEVGQQGGTMEDTLGDILSTMKATVGCPALTKDRIHWYTSVTYYTWRTEGVSCYRLRKGDDIRTLAIYFENNNNTHSAPKQGRGLGSNAATSAIASSFAIVIVFLLLASP